MIKKILLNLRGQIGLRTMFFNESARDDLDELFWAAAMSDLRVTCNTRYDLEIEFDSIKIRAWNANKYFAWLVRGVVYENGEPVFSWDDARPSAYVMWAFKNALERADLDGSLSNILHRNRTRQQMRVIN